MKPIALFLYGLLLTTTTVADEGMWPLNSLPKEKIQENYGTSLDDEWIEHVQKSCLRVSIGGSASFVSPHGLIMTNHHVGSKAIYDLSTGEQNLMEKGFYAESLDKELKCPNLYVDQLVSIQDVSEEIASHLSPEMTLSEKEKARKEAIASIKERAQKQSGLQPQIVTLYKGARFHLYLYKRYSDLRLVMCPEKAIASFGGDAENFEFPRYSLDVTFFRVYENGEPIHTDHYLRWSQGGPRLGEALFVFGHPGGTDRILTSKHLSCYRDLIYPLFFQYVEERIAFFEEFGEISEENRRIASKDKNSFNNSLKVFKGLIKGLDGETVIPNKEMEEEKLFQTLSVEEQKPWEAMDQCLDEMKTYYTDYFFLEGRGSRFSKMYGWAKHLVRVAEEQTKPNGKRFKEYTDSELPTLELAILTTEPVYSNYEKALLIDGLNRFKRNLGEDHPAVRAALGEKSVEDVVEEVMKGTELADLEYRQKLYQNGKEIQNSQDPLIKLVKAIEPYARKLRNKIEDHYEATQKDSYGKITHLLLDKHGESLYPDATFTLRMSIGSMIGYQEKSGFVNPITTLDGIFAQAAANNHQAPYALPPSWREKESSLNPSTPFNFVSTNDIIGGNSGSPIINAEGDVVGLIFDGNAHSFTWDFAFDQEKGRAISVHSEIIRHALKNVYHAEPLLKEIDG